MYLLQQNSSVSQMEGYFIGGLQLLGQGADMTELNKTTKKRLKEKKQRLPSLQKSKFLRTLIQTASIHILSSKVSSLPAVSLTEPSGSY